MDITPDPAFLAFDHAFDNNPLDGDRPSPEARYAMTENIHRANIAHPHGPSLSLCTFCGKQMRYVLIFVDEDGIIVPVCVPCSQTNPFSDNDAADAWAADSRMRNNAHRARTRRTPSPKAARYLASRPDVAEALSFAYADDDLADMHTMLHTSGRLSTKQAAAAVRIAAAVRE